jgi:hypothetical protein
MAVPVVAARAAVALLVDDLEAWGVRLALLVLVLVALPTTVAAVGFGGLLAIFGNVVPHPGTPALPGQSVEILPAVAPDVVHLGASGGRLIDGWVNRAALNQYDQRNYRSAGSWLAWRNADCSAAALDWLLGAYAQPLAAIDDAIALIGPNTGIWRLLSHAAACSRANHVMLRADCDRSLPQVSCKPGWIRGRCSWVVTDGSAKAIGLLGLGMTRMVSTSGIRAAGTPGT